MNASVSALASRASVALLLFAPLAACTKDAGDSGVCGGQTYLPLASGAAPSFELEDVNSTSTTYGELIGPSAHLGRISAWYFGHST